MRNLPQPVRQSVSALVTDFHAVDVSGPSQSVCRPYYVSYLLKAMPKTFPPDQKTNTKRNTQIQLVMKCQKDPTNAISLNSLWLKNVKDYILKCSIHKYRYKYRNTACGWVVFQKVMERHTGAIFSESPGYRDIRNEKIYFQRELRLERLVSLFSKVRPRATFTFACRRPGGKIYQYCLILLSEQLGNKRRLNTIQENWLL